MWKVCEPGTGDIGIGTTSTHREKWHGKRPAEEGIRAASSTVHAGCALHAALHLPKSGSSIWMRSDSSEHFVRSISSICSAENVMNSVTRTCRA